MTENGQFFLAKSGGCCRCCNAGEYSPDWAVLYRGENNIAMPYFSIETKIDKEDKDLTTVERRKIRCGESTIIIFENS
jgi:type III restriction enzyme